MSQVKAKFICNTITDNGTQKTANLTAVYGGSEENKSFSKYTPSGQLNITIDNETSAADFFQPKQEYFLTFEAASVVEG
ncbi:hypothetical protein A6C57_23360 [Fibrella sp. ES10-3-2-2]|nr:hypothetical protein A6C57_23360 [Fibrella sp. ES10-3-2-2]